MSNDATIDMDVACCGLESSVTRFLQKNEKRAQRHFLVSTAVEEEETWQIESLRDTANKCVKHACYALRKLTIKRASLLEGVQCLQLYWKNEWKRQLLENKLRNASNGAVRFEDMLRLVLSHLFQNYLRLRDGAVLLTSGECRHVGDSSTTQTNKKDSVLFPSRLSSLSTCRDGYTRVYSSTQGYSGFGWDELFNETVGIRTRLIKALTIYSRRNPSGIWDALLDNGAQVFESALDHHDTQMTQARYQLESFKSLLTNDVTSMLHSRARGGGIHMVTQDKMERMEVTVVHLNQHRGVSEIRFERLANNFTVRDKQGVLPDGWKAVEWSRAMKMKDNSLVVVNATNNVDPLSTSIAKNAPSSNYSRKLSVVVKKRYRRVVDDDIDIGDDDIDNNDGVNRCTTDNISEPLKRQKNKSLATIRESESSLEEGGLRVRITQKPNQSVVDSISSLAAIKMQLGVDAATLQTAREDLEAEAKSSTHFDADGKDGGIIQKDESIIELEVDIAEAREQVQMWRNNLMRKQNSRDGDEREEIWDARETLRESIMTLGGYFLTMHNVTLDMYVENKHAKKPLRNFAQEAEKAFREALDLIQEQKAFHDIGARQTNYIAADDSSTIQRNLLLLLGRARTNLGISLIEQSLLCKEEGKGPMIRKTSATLLAKGIEELGKAQENACAMRARAVTDTTSHGAKHMETNSDKLLADQLESLASRWLGTALWHQGKKKEAACIYENAAHLFTDRRVLQTENAELLNEEMLLGVECFYCCSMLIELASGALEKLPCNSEYESSGNELLSFAYRGYELGAASGRMLHRMTLHKKSPSTFKDLQAHKDIMNEEESLKLSVELKRWWERKKATLAVHRRQEGMLSSSTVAVNTNIPRNNLSSESGSNNHSENVPRKIFVVTGRTSRRLENRTLTREGRTNGRSTGALLGKESSSVNAFDNFETGAILSDPFPQDKNRQQQLRTEFRKWGDELLPMISGKAIASCYPSIVLEHPSGMVPPKNKIQH